MIEINTNNLGKLIRNNNYGQLNYTYDEQEKILEQQKIQSKESKSYKLCRMN